MRSWPNAPLSAQPDQERQDRLQRRDDLRAEYLSIAGDPTICLFENKTGIDAYRPPPWRTKFPARQMAVVLHDVRTADAMKRAVREMVRKRAGYGYVTERSGANPWDRLPRYWDQEVAAVAEENHRAAAGRK